MGLRDLFRKNTGDGAPERGDVRPAAVPPGPEGLGPEPPAPGPAVAAPEDPGHRDTVPPATGHGGAGYPGPEGRGPGEPRPAEGPLAVLVDRLAARGADRAVLTLVQRGNTMTHQTEQSVGDAAPSVESGTVDQDSPLFDPVADLYSEAMSAPRGAWQHARIEVGPEQDGIRSVLTTFGFPDGAQDEQTWRSGRPAPAASATGTDGTGHAPAPAAGAFEDGTEPPEAEQSGAEPVPVTAATPVTRVLSGTGDGLGSSATGPDRAPAGDTAPTRRADEPAPAGGGAPPEESVPVDGSATGPQFAPATGPQFAPATGSAGGPGAAPQPPTEPTGGPEPAADPSPGGDVQEVPDHVDHEEWHEDVEPPAPTGAAAAAAAGTGEDHDASAPGTAVSTDVAPSYRAPKESGDRPSEDRPAPGNLVLKEADVLRRLADAQRRLFGPDGTAMDVSTVLVRVRALGTYYDALTHVRKNGFWDQRRTFDLVPEELLHVQELKDESYVEGTGSPLAMMFRFRPGIPPEVSFDYADEEAFVRYERRLPGQNYLEELRMYPRTGANIPQHMNEALQDWNY